MKFKYFINYVDSYIHFKLLLAQSDLSNAMEVLASN